MKRKKSIGIFDSGVGGLSIARAIKQLLPDENLVYFADIEFSPYGNKPQKTINQRSEDIVNFLIKQDCKIVVMACNTATVNSISDLRSKFSIPIIGVEPAIKPAALQSKTGVIGVLATEQTLESASFQLLKSKHIQKVNIETKACPKFVSLVESLNHDNKQALEIAEQYIQPLLSKGCDQIVLGCTHFSFLRSTIDRVVGKEANVIDTATPVAMQVKRQLHHNDLKKISDVEGVIEFWTSGDPIKATESISELWEQDVNVAKAELIT
ncbi:MAG: glutamate racemase [Colwellia sp.]|nr:glutamate racemase [Colwellia sp.]MCW8863323.1 glutamate racemase [Colwellia sp.]MCW9080937.1 glutamate racemase [Colwellia sp.]